MANEALNKKKTNYFIHLDVLRFFAAFAVLLFHYHAYLKGHFPEDSVLKLIDPIINKGHLGVNLFFVLSAFLITYLVIMEIEKYRTFSIRYFLIRRTLRIWPLYFATVLLSFWVVNSFPIFGQTEHSIEYFIFFLANFSELNFGLNDAYTQLTIPWSVSIEEQFYIFWALVIGGFSIVKKNKLLLLFCLLFIFSFVFRILNYEDQRILYYHTFSAVNDFSIGAIIAWLFINRKKSLLKFVELSQLKLIAVWIGIFIVIILKNKIFHFDWFVVFERTVISLLLGWIIVRLISEKFKFSKKLKPIAIHFGKISYGIYMFHALFLFFVEVINYHYQLSFTMSILALFIAMFLTILFSHLSYTYYEKYFLRMKNNYKKI